MSRQHALDLVGRYYEAFNANDRSAMLACLTEDIVHDINQGSSQLGKAAFRAFLDHMDQCYRENLSNIIIMASEDGRHASAQFIVHGAYLTTDEGLPKASGQQYELPAGAFFAITDGLISQVTVYYNLADWTTQVSK